MNNYNISKIPKGYSQIVNHKTDNATSWYFSPSSPVSSTNNTGRHDITEILLNVALNTMKQLNKQKKWDETLYRKLTIDKL